MTTTSIADANKLAGSSPATDANKSGASSATEDAKLPFEEQAIKAFDSDTRSDSSPADNGQEDVNKTTSTGGAEGSESGVQKTDDTEKGQGTDGQEKKEEVVVDKKEEPEVKLDNKDGKETKDPIADEKLEFHKHPRFQELLKESKEGKAFMEKAKPTLDRMEKLDTFLTSNGISNKQFIDALEISALINSDPKAAKERLQGINDYLNGFTGDVLPQDLAKEVEAGTLPLGRAKEIAQLRNQNQHQGKRSQQTEAQKHAETVFTALTSWENLTQTKDPDYTRKQPQVNSRFVALIAEEEMKTRGVVPANRQVQLAQQAYDDVNSFINSFIPKPSPTTKTLQTNGARTTAKTEPKNWNEVEEFLVNNFKG